MGYSVDTKSDLVTTVHSAISASVTSANTTPVDCRNYNAILIYAELSDTPNWSIDIESSDTKEGAYIDSYDGTLATDKQLTTGSLTASRIVLYKGIGNWVKVVPTRTAGTATIKVQPVNV